MWGLSNQQITPSMLVSWAGLIVCDVMNNNEDDFGDSSDYS